MAAPTVRGRTAPLAGGASLSPVATAVGDMVIVFTWERAGAGVPTHTLQSGFTEIFTHSHNDGSTDGCLSVAYKIATAGGAGSYQAYTTSTGTPTWWTGLVVLQAGTFGGAIASNSTSQTNNAVPNPPSVTLGATRDWLVLAVGAWHHGSSTTITPTAPTNYGNLIEVAGLSNGDLGIADRALTAPASEDPGTFGDNISPNGTVAATVAVGSVLASTASVGVSATGGIETSGTFFSVLEKAVATAAAAVIVVAGQVVPGVTTHERSAALSATGLVASSGESFSVLEAGASLAGSGGIETSGEAFSLLERSASLSATGSTTTGQQRDLLRAVATTSTAGIDTSGYTERSRAAGLSATAQVETSGQRDHPRAVTVAASVSLTTGSERDLHRQVTTDATASITASGSIAGAPRERSASLSATGSIQTTGAIPVLVQRATSLQASGVISAAGTSGDVGVPVRGPTGVSGPSGRALVSGMSGRSRASGSDGRTMVED